MHLMIQKVVDILFENGNPVAIDGEKNGAGISHQKG